MSESERPSASEPEWCHFVCPFCKGDVDRRDAAVWVCGACGGTFPRVDGVVDARRHYPAGVPTPPGWDEWVDGQRHYEEWAHAGPPFELAFEDQRAIGP